MSEMRKALEVHKHIPTYAFLLEHGRDYAVGPETYAGKRGDQGQCFKNATHLAIDAAFYDRDLTYVEGKVAVYGVVIDHAWCVDGDGIVIDPTMGPAKDGSFARIDGYFGVPFLTEYVRKACLRNGVYGLLDLYNAKKTAPKLIELGLEGGQQWLIGKRRAAK